MKSALCQYHYLYKITNLINNKIYIGIHSTNRLADGYFGSGIILRKAIKKYGKDYFTKEIIEWFDWRIEAINRESEIVNEEFVKRNDTYNRSIGGSGGLVGCMNGFYNKKHNEETVSKIKKYLTGKFLSDITKHKMSKSRIGDKNPMFGKTHSDEATEKIRNSNIDRRATDETKNKMRVSSFNKIYGVSDITKSRMKANNAKSKNIVIDGIKYVSLRDAATILNTTVYKIKKEAKCR